MLILGQDNDIQAQLDCRILLYTWLPDIPREYGRHAFFFMRTDELLQAIHQPRQLSLYHKGPHELSSEDMHYRRLGAKFGG